MTTGDRVIEAVVAAGLQARRTPFKDEQAITEPESIVVFEDVAFTAGVSVRVHLVLGYSVTVVGFVQTESGDKPVSIRLTQLTARVACQQAQAIGGNLFVALMEAACSVAEGPDAFDRIPAPMAAGMAAVDTPECEEDLAYRGHLVMLLVKLASTLRSLR